MVGRVVTMAAELITAAELSMVAELITDAELSMAAELITDAEPIICHGMPARIAWRMRIR